MYKIDHYLPKIVYLYRVLHKYVKYQEIFLHLKCNKKFFMTVIEFSIIKKRFQLLYFLVKRKFNS